MWMRGIRTNCLMKVHFARHELHHVDLMGGAAPVHDLPCFTSQGEGGARISALRESP